MPYVISWLILLLTPACINFVQHDPILLQSSFGLEHLNADTMRTTGKPDSYLLNDAEPLKEESDNSLEQKANELYLEGMALFNAGDYPGAIELYNQALNVAREADAAILKARTLNNIGIIYAELSGHDKALEHFLHALRINNRINDSINIAKTNANIGNLYINMRKYEEALKHLQESQAIFEREELLNEIARTLNNIGEIHKLQRNYTKALQFHLEALDLRKKLGDNRMTAHSYANVGSTYNQTGAYARAVEYLEQAQTLIEPEQDMPGLLSIYNYLAHAFNGLGQHEQARTYLYKGLSLSKEIGMRRGMVQFYIALANLYATLEEKDLAIDYYRSVINHRDTLYDEQTNRRIAEMRIIYETEKKEQENQLLHNEIALQQLKIQQTNTYIIATLIVLCLFIGLSIFAYMAFRNKKKALEKEQELNHLRSQFISTLSHELQTPLAGIMSSAQLLDFFNQAWNENERKDYFNNIYRSVKHLKTLLEEVGSISENDSFVLQFEPRYFDVRQEIETLIEETKTSFDKDVHIELIHKGSKNEVYADKKLFRYIMNNLLNNAMKYSGNGKKVVVTLNTDLKQKMIIAIQDWGIGIPEENLPHIFNKFARADNVGDIPGTGMGLSIVKHLLQLHNGKMDMKSKVSKGTTVTVELPVEYK